MQAPALQTLPRLQTVHWLPLSPHALGVGGLTQLPLSQQPLGHDVLSQTQLPVLSHRWPAAHDGFTPQWQAPFVQESEKVGLHSTQVAPASPHCDSPGAAQTPLKQQPLGQDAGLHSQLPLTHC